MIVLLLGSLIFRQHIIVNKLIPHWQSVLAKKYSLSKYELLEQVNKDINGLPWMTSRYKQDCEDANILPTYYRKIVVNDILSVIFFIILILTLAYVY